MAHARLTWALAALWSALACGAPPATPPATPPPPPAAAQPLLPAGSAERVASARTGLSVTLPSAGSWRIDDGARWLVASHAESRSELSLRVWRAHRRVRIEECRAQVALWRPEFPTWSETEVLDQRDLQAPKDFAGTVTVLVRPVVGSSELEGWVVAFGASIDKCFAGLFRTRASGSGAEAALGDRLAQAVDQLLPSAAELGVDARVPSR
ncbi:MAG: hypothetical protein KF718_19835 [Polyangiaceae bacterium]|nr:hypothetical protein [Polyangiaceae bacterium]